MLSRMWIKNSWVKLRLRPPGHHPPVRNVLQHHGATRVLACLHFFNINSIFLRSSLRSVALRRSGFLSLILTSRFYLRIRNNRRSRILRLALLLQARQSRGERGVAESRSTRQPPLLEATLEGREKQYQNLKNLNGYPRNRLESSGPWRNWVWRRSFHPDSLEDQQAEETEAYRLENEAPSNYLIDSMEARSRSNNANRMRRGKGQDRS